MEMVSVGLQDPPGERLTVAGLRDVVGSVGVTAVARLTLPENPLRLFSRIVAVAAFDPDDPCGRAMSSGVAEMEKSPLINGVIGGS